MKIPTKKAGEFELPVLGLGTWRVGGDYKRDPDFDDAQAIKVIRQAISLGIAHIDTAEMYAGGYAEELIAKAIKKFDRKKLFITSKVLPRNLHYKNVIKAIQGSLKRLQLKHLDLYLIHAPNPDIPLKETMQAMDFLLDKGLTRYIGVSNFDWKLIEEAQRYTKHKIVTNQIHYNLNAREYETDGTIDYCAEHEILVTAYRPYGGTLRGAVNEEALQNLTKKYQKTYAQIAINWVIGKPNVVALFKTVNSEHLKENLGALGWELGKEDRRLLDSSGGNADMVHGPNPRQ